MSNESFNAERSDANRAVARAAGCYSVAEILQKMEQRRLQKSINELVVFLLLACMCYFLTACGTWSVQFGMSEYNSSNETRAFKQTEDKKKP